MSAVVDFIWRDPSNREVAYHAMVENTYDFSERKGWSVLTYAAFHGHVAVMDTLIIDFEWDPDAKDVNGVTALYAATVGNQAEAVKRLLYWGADPGVLASDEQWTPLQAATYLDFTEIACLLGGDP